MGRFLFKNAILIKLYTRLTTSSQYIGLHPIEAAALLMPDTRLQLSKADLKGVNMTAMECKVIIDIPFKGNDIFNRIIKLSLG